MYNLIQDIRLKYKPAFKIFYNHLDFHDITKGGYFSNINLHVSKFMDYFKDENYNFMNIYKIEENGELKEE